MARCLRLAFLGTPAFAVPTLAALIAAGHDLAAVYTQPPRPAGRGKLPTPSPVQLAAEKNKLPVLVPASLKDAAVQADFAALGLDAAVVVAYGLILPPAILAAPRLGCFNVHASLLPRWRGAAPIQRALMAGDAETGIAIMRMEAGLDTGPVLKVERLRLGALDTTGTVQARLAEVGARLMVETLEGVAAGSLVATPQPSEGVTYAKKIEREEERIDWRRKAIEIDRQIRALSPAPGAWFAIGEERIKVFAVTPVDLQGTPGKVLDDAPTIACGVGALRLERLQRPGKAAMAAAEFQRGRSIAPGSRLA